MIPNPEYVSPSHPVPPSELVATLEDGTKVKRRIPRMRACDERNAKGKACHGHLKRLYALPSEVQARFGVTAEIYRCEHCKTLFLPSEGETPRTRTLAW